jgi:hypothetical protein
VAALLAVSVSALAADAKPADKNKKPAGGEKKVYTNEDLEKAGKGDGNGSGAVTFLAEPEGGSITTGSEATSGGEGGYHPAAREDGTLDETGWRARAREYREAVVMAKAEVEKLEAKLQALSNPMRQPQPIEALQPDPNHLLTTSEERQKLEAELKAARDAVADAEKQLEDFLEDARRKSIPPGWLEDR